MKHTLTVIALLMMTGCSTYQTHLRTGCIWSCAQWEQWEREGQLASGSGTIPNTYQPSGGISARTYITPVGSYQAIRSGSTTTITRVAR